MEKTSKEVIRNATYELVARIIGVLIGLIVVLLVYWIAR